LSRKGSLAAGGRGLDGVEGVGRLEIERDTDSGTVAASAGSSIVAVLVTAKWCPAVKVTGPAATGVPAGTVGFPSIVMVNISVVGCRVVKSGRVKVCDRLE
jgi:hypothetical protein